MIHRSRALALRAAACAAAALAVAGCSQSSTSANSSSISVTGHTLDIYLSEPATIASDTVAQDVVDAERLAFDEHSSEVTDYKLRLRVVRSSQVSQNARDAIEDNRAIAYLGEIAPGASDDTVGITNALDLLQVSPTDTALELGQGTSAVTSAPQTFFESWGSFGRTFARLVPSSAQEATAQVAEMKSLGVTSLFISDDGSDYGRSIAQAVRKAAGTAGLTVQSGMSGASGIFYGAQSPSLAAKFFGGASAVDPNAKLFGPSSLNTTIFTKAVAGSLHNLYVTIPGFMPKQLNSAGQAFTKVFAGTYGHQPNVEAIFGYEAMTALLAVLKQAGSSANDRATVVRDFLKLSESQSVLGPYKIDSNGNTSLDAFVVARFSGGTLQPFRAAPTQG
ncbi:MAG TPA: ABC transporter substrate-binding protein [Solirubrobacteraceae bacterium]|nr:ABC transporter substrate-binding protein [Solirubrobacteraceae bacterium]